MTISVERIKKVIARQRSEAGVVVRGPDGKRLAYRPPLPGAEAVIVCLDHKPPAVDASKLDAYRARPKHSLVDRED